MRTLNRLILAGAALAGTISPAFAGGFQRGQADTDLLYEPGRFSSRAGFSYIDPKRGFETVNGAAVDEGSYTGRYRLPSLAVKYGGGPLACVGTYIQSFAADADYTGLPGGAQPAPAGFALGSRNREMGFDSDEVAVTCRASYETGGQRFSLLGGLYAEDFDFSASSFAVVPSGQSVRTPFGTAPVYLPAEIDVDADTGFDPGFRAGLAYEMPEIALRAQILYRSQTTHETPSGSAAGALAAAPFVLAPDIGPVGVPSPMPIGTALPIPDEAHLSDVVSPQSLGLNVQTGIAPGTIVTASLRWTDWSTNRELVTRIGDNPGSITPFRWDDGYTASLGIGRALTEKLSVLAAVGFDSGVSTGAETTYTDLYTLSGAVSFKEGPGEIRVGGLVGYWTSGAQSVSRGALFDASVGDDVVTALSATVKLSF
jgi:long-chain fatty acid transport protein